MTVKQSQLILEKIEENTDLTLEVRKSAKVGFTEVIQRIKNVEMKHASKET